MLKPLMRSLGPVVARAPLAEAARAGAGALCGLGLVGLLLLSPGVDLATGLYLVAPFGATSVLLFAVPNSPLAQPWSAVVGNTVAALVAVAVCLCVADPVLRIALAVGLAITATMLCRAVHPPAGAVAMTAAMSPEAIDRLGFWFALTPIASGTLALVALASLYARLTGRHYPARQVPPQALPDRAAASEARLSLSEPELTAILERYRQSFNIGAADLARLIGAAERQVLDKQSGPLTAGGIMSSDLITVGPETGMADVADLFRRHRFTSLPVVGPGARFYGVIFQIHLIERAREDALRLERSLLAAFRRLLSPSTGAGATAADLMSVAGPRAVAGTPASVLLGLMAEQEVDAVPVLERGRIIGIVTRTDMMAALVHRAAVGGG
ncbi:HPP family protein [Frigidibacter sp. MR17.14]|uniref:HPP family protein n=1 Tax=Frigidibacter sp. MR17.14 TaxID=3126509 RepID=UPI003012CB79